MGEKTAETSCQQLNITTRTTSCHQTISFLSLPRFLFKQGNKSSDNLLSTNAAAVHSGSVPWKSPENAAQRFVQAVSDKGNKDTVQAACATAVQKTDPALSPPERKWVVRMCYSHTLRKDTELIQEEELGRNHIRS